jgi:hypothetical protein
MLMSDKPTQGEMIEVACLAAMEWMRLDGDKFRITAWQPNRETLLKEMLAPGGIACHFGDQPRHKEIAHQISALPDDEGKRIIEAGIVEAERKSCR